VSTAVAEPIDRAALAAEMRALVEASGSSFHSAMRLLPAQRRDAMYAIYAFCRAVDDIADEPGSLAEKRTALAAWRVEIDALYAGRPSYRIAQALEEPVQRFSLRREDFIAVIDGMQMDAERDIRRPSLDELDLYCDRVASAVGRLSVRAFGSTETRADDVATSLGRALQLTNILRDLKEDADRGRLYLPDELLAKYGIAGDDPLLVLSHPALGKACADLAAIARRHYIDADNAMADCARAPMRPAALMSAVYRNTLDLLERRGWAGLDRPVKLSKPRKLWLLLRHGLI
jgi:presqualene diphosphate synthase